MCKCSIGLSHTMHLFLPSHSCTLSFCGCHNFSCQLFRITSSISLPGKPNNPLHPRHDLSLRMNLGRNLKSRSSDPTTAHLYLRHDRIKCFFPGFIRSEEHTSELQSR